MAPNKEYALLCEFATMSVNGLHSYLHVFDRTMFAPEEKIVFRGFFGARLVNLPVLSKAEVYITDSGNTLLPNGKLFSGEMKGPAANLVARIPALVVPALGEYKIWARLDGGEPIHLCSWEAILKQ